MQSYSLLLLLLASFAYAAPKVHSTLSTSRTLQDCEQAENCETYKSANRTMIRFKNGMEPGSADYIRRFPNATATGKVDVRGTNMLQKQNTVKTSIYLGQGSIDYGTINPCHAIHHLYDVCHETTCDNSAYPVQSETIRRYGISGSGPTDLPLSLQATGQYSGWNDRNTFVDAIVAGFSHGQRWTRHPWSIHTKDGDDFGVQYWGEQTGFINVNRFHNGNLQGYMTAQITHTGVDSGFCTAIGLAGAVAGAFNGFAGGIFGLVSAVCQ